MAKLTCLSDVDIFARDQKLSKTFYSRKIGLKVRSSDPKFGYLALGATKGGEDASLSIWQPSPDWGEQYETAMQGIGEVTGIAFRTGNLAKTVQDFSRRGVKVEKSSDTFARFWDPDGNSLFLEQDRRPKVRRAGIQALSWRTVVARDEARSGAFFRTLGLRARKVRGEEGGESREWTVYQLSPKGTAVMPFTPVREMYENPADYVADMAHIGENTGIMFETDDAYALEKKLLAKGVRFKQRAEERDWGSIAMRVFDPDDNDYMIYQMK